MGCGGHPVQCQTHSKNPFCTTIENSLSNTWTALSVCKINNECRNFLTKSSEKQRTETWVLKEIWGDFAGGGTVLGLLNLALPTLYSPGIFGSSITHWLVTFRFLSTMLKNRAYYDMTVVGRFVMILMPATSPKSWILLYIKFGYLQVKTTHTYTIIFLLRDPRLDPSGVLS